MIKLMKKLEQNPLLCVFIVFVLYITASTLEYEDEQVFLINEEIEK